MRWIFIILIFPLNITRAQVSDNFSDGDFTSNPQWIGSTDLFRVETSGYMLQLYAPLADGQAWLFTNSQAMENAVWQFRFRMGFNPSSANYAQVYLACENGGYPDYGSSFYLVIGTTDDNISLWEKRNGVSSKLIEGLKGRLSLSTIDAMIRVTRNKGGLFILECNMGNGWVEEGRYESSQGLYSSWFGLSCHYTSSRSTSFYFDDFQITGEAYKDTIPPVVNKFEVKNRYGFRLTFSKPVSKLIVNPGNFMLEPGNKTPEILTVVNDSYSLDLLFRQGIPLSTQGAVTISGLSDSYGNVMADAEYVYTYDATLLTSTAMSDLRNLNICFSRQINPLSAKTNNFYWIGTGPEITTISDLEDNCISLVFGSDFPDGQTLQLGLKDVIALNGDTIDAGPYPLFYYLVSRNDIVFSEIMYDPDPVVELPNQEYIELYNRGGFPVQLSDYKLSSGTNKTSLGTYILYPDEYLLLVPSGGLTEWPFTTNILAVSSWPTLTNSGNDIVLYNKSDLVIASLKYDKNMGPAGYKQDGGWSLEIKDPDNLSGDWDNWDFSNCDKGGTPGEKNYVDVSFPDIKPPVIDGVYIKDETSVVIEFSEPMAFIDGIDPEIFGIEPDGLSIISCNPEEPFLMNAEISYSQKMEEDKMFTLRIKSLPTDLAGNVLDGDPFVYFGWPVSPLAGDIVINELLYDPAANGSDYLELFNCSEHMLDLSETYVARNNEENIPEELVRLSQEKRIFIPKSYLVLSPDKDWLLNNYQIDDENSAINLTGLPNYLTPEGTVFVTNRSGGSLDRLDYSDKMHFALLTNTKGVALERIDFNILTQESSNWHSASSTSGYGTPGMENSQAVSIDPLSENDFIKIEPEIFYPNQDGYDDLLFIKYSFKEAGNSCTVTIFNRDGRPVRHLINNELTGVDGFFTWDGLNDRNGRCSSGIYIVWCRSFNVNGNISETRKVAVLGSGRP